MHMAADSEDDVARQKGLILREYYEEFEASRQDKVNFTLKRFVSRPGGRVVFDFNHLGFI